MGLRRVLWVLVPLWVGGCATPGALTRVPGTVLTAVPPGLVWGLEVSGCARAGVCGEVRTALVGQIAVRGLALRVVAPGEPAAILVRVVVGREAAASVVAQGLAGAVRGGAAMTARVAVSDLRGVVLRAFTARSESVVHPFAMEAGLQDQYAGFAGEIADGLGP